MCSFEGLRFLGPGFQEAQGSGILGFGIGKACTRLALQRAIGLRPKIFNAGTAESPTVQI